MTRPTGRQGGGRKSPPTNRARNGRRTDGSGKKMQATSPQLGRTGPGPLGGPEGPIWTRGGGRTGTRDMGGGRPPPKSRGIGPGTPGGDHGTHGAQGAQGAQGGWTDGNGE